jgi:hypothetical protein
VHTDDRAAESARQLRAAAYTSGSHIAFANGAYAPHTPRGDALLAHELVHVEQNRAGPPPADAPLVGRAHDAAEHQAHRFAAQLAAGDRPSLAPVRPTAVLGLVEENWYHGYAEHENATHAADGSVVHDLGDGRYLSDSLEVANVYANRRASAVEDPGARRVMERRFDPYKLGRVLDLTEEPEFMNIYNVVSRGIKVSGEPYRNILDGFLQRKGLKLEAFDFIIGPEGPLGGRQINVRNPEIAKQIWAGLKPGKPGGGNPGGVEVEPPAVPAEAPPTAEAPAQSARAGGGQLVGAVKTLGPLLLGAINSYLMSSEDAKLVPGRVERALADQAVQRRSEDLVDARRLGIARAQRHGADVFITVRIRLTFTNGIQDRMDVADPELTDRNQTAATAPIRMSDDPILGTETSVGWFTSSLLLSPVETSRSESIGLELEDAGPQHRTRLLEQQRAARGDEERARQAEIGRPAVLTDPRARAKQQAAIADRLHELNKAPGSGAPMPVPPGPPALTVVSPTPAPPTFLPGAPGDGPIQQAATVVGQFRIWTSRLDAEAQALDARLGSGTSPTPAERQAFLGHEEDWRLSIKYAMNKYKTDGRDEAVNALGELVDRYAVTFAQVRSRLGG